MGPPFDDFTSLPTARLRAMRRAERDFFKVLGVFARAGRHPVKDILDTAEGPFTTFAKYPRDGVGSAADRCAWYYHAHDPDPERPWQENGHFHCFAYTELLPPTAVPLALPPNPNLEEGGLAHLVAICVNAEGIPDRLFTLNRWASDEWLYPAEEVIPLLDRFSVKDDDRFALTSQWLSALMRLLQPRIACLLRERDTALEELRAHDPQGFSETPSLEVASMQPFDLDAHIAALDRALAAAGIPG